MFVRPREGSVIRDPANVSVQLPAQGAEVPRTTYWLRRIAKGDVQLVEDTEALRSIQVEQTLGS